MFPAGQNACVEGGFAQCVGGTFVVTECAGGLKCFALPLVNSRGTSITCDTEGDALARIAASGATGGLTGDGSAETPSDETETPPAFTSGSASVPSATPTTGSTGGFKAQNGRDAQALNAKFATLSASSACNGQFIH